MTEDIASHRMRQAGYQLDKAQNGNDPADWKPMPSIGEGDPLFAR